MQSSISISLDWVTHSQCNIRRYTCSIKLCGYMISKLFTTQINNFTTDNVVIMDFLFCNVQFKNLTAKSLLNCHCSYKALPFCNISIRPVFA